jgi:hypothetical protein
MCGAGQLKKSPSLDPGGSWRQSQRGPKRKNFSSENQTNNSLFCPFPLQPSSIHRVWKYRLRTSISLHPSPSVPIFKLGHIEIGTMPTSLTALWKVGMGPFRLLEKIHAGHSARGFRGKGQKKLFRNLN